MSTNNGREILEIKVPSFSTLPHTIINADIKENMAVVGMVLNNPSAQTSTWTFVTSNGSVTINGSISGETAIPVLSLMTNTKLI